MRRSQFLSVLLLLPLALSFQGCGIFSYLGDAISQTYDNTVAYFNIYYNASKIFSEAEAELLDAERLNRSKGLPTLAQSGIPAAIKQKFGTVIDKCSNILAFHQQSALVDDALLLIGKSYYYQAEYVKAERKFAELIGQYPASNLRLEADVWLLRSMAMINRHDDVLERSAVVLENARSRPDMVGEVYRIMAGCYEKKDDMPKAIDHYQKAVELMEDKEARSEGQKALADLLFRTSEFRRAASAYMKLAAIADDPYLEYYGTLQTARCYRLLGTYDAALRLVEELQDDFRFNQYLDAILLERARILAARGDYAGAAEEYAYVDTSYSRTEAGWRAAYEGAQLLEEKMGDYAAAWVAYARAGVAQNPEVSAKGRRKSAAFNTYFETRKEIARLDSLLDEKTAVVPDSVRERPGVSDAARDSLKQLRGKALYRLGELFYSELNRADSSVFYYREAIKSYRDSVATPRAFFILADLARVSPEHSPASSDEWYRRLVQEFPSSPYSVEARKLLGQMTQEQRKDPAEDMFRMVEERLEKKDFVRAIRDLHSLRSRFPASPFAAKSVYTIGWIYEHHLHKPDSALKYYTLLLDQYGGSLYASAVREKVSPADGTVQPDTSSATAVTPAPPGNPVQQDDDQLRGGRRPMTTDPNRKKEGKKEDQ